MRGKLRVLAAGAHPDDIEICCAGTLARYAEEGHKTFISITCRGNAGTLHASAEEIVKIRAKEAKRAADMTGAELITLDFGDAELFYNKESLAVFIDLVRQVRPHVIITHPPEEENMHNDHWLTCRLIMHASQWATHHNLGMELKYPPTETTPSLFYFDRFMSSSSIYPTHYVDISSTFEIKKKALSQHQSQISFTRKLYGPNFIECVEIMAKLRGYECGVKYAEAFRELAIHPRVRPYRVLP